jgi:hypothetical protein
MMWFPVKYHRLLRALKPKSSFASDIFKGAKRKFSIARKGIGAR